MADELGELMQDGFAAPLGDVIASVGRGVADAQAALDRASLAQTLELYGTEGDDALKTLREIGYRPTFYVLPETTCEVQVSLRIAGSGGTAGLGTGNAASGATGAIDPRVASAALSRSRLYITPVDAGFANRYAYDARASAKLTFRIVPVPPPSALDDTRPAPPLVGRSASEAAATLAALGFTTRRVDGAGEVVVPEATTGLVVKAQSPTAWSLVPPGSVVTVTLGAA
jgi:hypothetical protein